MIIGIDGNEANNRPRVGIGEFAYELLQFFAKDTLLDREFTIYLKKNPLKDLPEDSKKWKYNVFGPSPFWTQFALPAHLYLKKPRPDVFFSPSHYAPRFSPIPTVISLMDLSYIHFPELFKKSDLYQLKHWTAYSVKNAAKILTISKASKDDIIKIYGVPEEKVVVVYPGIKSQITLEPHVYPMKEIYTKFGISGNFILFVGTLQPRKNIVRLIEAFSRIQKNKKNNEENVTLVIVGKKGWQYDDIFSAPEKFGVVEQVKFLDFVSNEDLVMLYKHARCYVLPSLYEGFGLPVLEAMKNDCPVITSNVSSLPEAGGDACLYVDPTDVADIAEKIQMVLSDEKLRNELIEKGRTQIKKFSWEKTAKEALEVLQSVAITK